MADPQLRLVLIAEDDPLIAELITLVVDYAGYAPLVADTGQRALALARDRRPALLIAGSMLAEVDGAALIGAVRTEVGQNLPIILVTSLVTAPVAAAGATAVVTKPFHIADLEALITQLLPRWPG